jgi:hypothetical protein
MKRELVAGVIAGATGTVALNVVTYLDMTARGRPPSELPAKAANRIAKLAGVSLGTGKDADNRREGLGALLGYATGLGVGAVYGLTRGVGPHGTSRVTPNSDNPSLARSASPLATAVGLGAVAMVASNVPMTVLGLTDPREWNASDWLADAVPHLAYGVAAALTFDVVTR